MNRFPRMVSAAAVGSRTRAKIETHDQVIIKWRGTLSLKSSQDPSPHGFDNPFATEQQKTDTPRRVQSEDS
jgi:hypothetical protein